MKKIISFNFIIAFLLIVSFCFSGCNKKDDTKIRIGWQIAWATQGQLAMILQNTNIMELNDIKGDFKSFTYGAPLSEAALSGQLDVAFIGDQPAINLISKSQDWKIVARLMDFRVAIVIPPNSSIKEVSDLKGKTIGIPFGASTHRFALQVLKDAGLDPQKDVKIINIDIQEQSDIINSGEGKSWKKVDAFASWDHHIALYESKGLAKILKSGTALGVIAMSNKFIEKNRESAISFLTAFKQAYYFYSNNQDLADKWFSDEAQGKFDIKILNSVAAIEPNIKIKEILKISIEISKENQKTLQDASDFALEQKLIQNKINITDCLKPELMTDMDKLISKYIENTKKIKSIK